MECTDCKGSGIYVGLGHYNERETCRRCNGSKDEPSRIGTTGTPLRDYQQDALGNVLAERALWTGHAELITKHMVLRVSEDQGRFPRRVTLALNPNCTSFTQLRDDNTGKPARFNDPTNGVHWLLLGRRGEKRAADLRLMTWDSIQIPSPVIEGYAQDHYLTLYKRIDMKNEFKCLWHY